MKQRLIIVVSAMLLLCVLGFRQAPRAWEYKVEYFGTISEKRLNELGSQGWELVSTNAVIKNGDTNITEFYFKRPK